MIKNDTWITQMAEKGMISPFEPQLVRKVEGLPVISYGLSSYGLRFAPLTVGVSDL